MEKASLDKSEVNKLVLEQCFNLETALMYVETDDGAATVWFPEMVQNDPELAKRFTSASGTLEPPKTLCVLTEDPNPEVVISDPNAVSFLTGSVVTGPRAYTTWVPAPNVFDDPNLIAQLEQDYDIEVALEPDSIGASRAGLPIFHGKHRGELVALLALTAENAEVQGGLTTQDWIRQMLESFSRM
jgi:hypothetical protein